MLLGRKDRSRKDFLNQRKREREERELERLRLNSSIIIQSGLLQNPKNPIFPRLSVVPIVQSADRMKIFKTFYIIHGPPLFDIRVISVT